MAASFYSPTHVSSFRPYSSETPGVSYEHDLYEPDKFSYGDELEDETACSRINLLNDTDMSKSDNCNEMFELNTRNRIFRGKNTETLATYAEVVLKPEDTLNSIALRYGCKVAELKRINKLILDQDLYGLKKIRIPVVQHGFVQELIEYEQPQPTAASTSTVELRDDDCDDDEFQSNDTSRLLERRLSNSRSTQGQQAVQYLQKVDRDIKKIIISTKSQPFQPDDCILRPTLNRQTSITVRWKSFVPLLAAILIIPLVITVFLFLKHLIGR